MTEITNKKCYPIRIDTQVWKFGACDLGFNSRGAIK